MATDTQIARLRSDLHLSLLSPLDLDDYFTRSEEDYPDNLKVSDAQARVYVILALMAEAADEVSYTEGASSESKSDRYGNLEKLLAKWEAKVADGLNADAVLPVDFGGIVGAVPHTYEAYPDSDAMYPPDYEILP